MNYLNEINFDDLAEKVASLAIKKANDDLAKYREYIKKNKRMKFSIGQIVKKVRNSVMDGLMGENEEYYVISPFEYNPIWNDEVNYYLTRLGKQTLLGVRESEIEAVKVDINSMPDEVKKFYFRIGGVDLEFKTFTVKS